MEIIIIIAFMALAWLIWQLTRAKRFTKFKMLIEQEIKPKVIAEILNELNKTRSDEFPNNEIHQQATILYWTQYKARILQAALQRGIIDKKWLEDTGNLRNSQHLFHIEQHRLHKGHLF